jgi:hypothetical protein
MAASLWGSPAHAQSSTVILNQPTQVTDTTIRNGAYKNTNYDDSVLLTRASNDPDWERRAIFKFDTKTTIPENSAISSAILTLTVKSGLGTAGQTRPIGVYRVSSRSWRRKHPVIRQDALNESRQADRRQKMRHRQRHQRLWRQGNIDVAISCGKRSATPSTRDIRDSSWLTKAATRRRATASTTQRGRPRAAARP